jgi:hypothetical protein
MKDLAEIQAGDALVALKREKLFDREYYKSLAASTARGYAAQFMDEYQVDRMSPAGWRVLDAYLRSDR